MNEILKALLDKHAETATEQRADALGEALAGHNLEELRDSVVTRFEELHTAESVSADEISEMEALADIAEAITGRLVAEVEQQARTQSANERMAAARAAAQQASEQAQQQADAQAHNDDDAQGGDENAGEQPQAHAQDETPDAGATSAESNDHGGEQADTQAGGQAGDPELVTAASRPNAPAQRVPIGRMNSTPARPARDPRRPSYSIIAAADIPGISTGAELDGLDGLAAAMVSRFTGLARLGPGRATQTGIAVIRRERDDDFTLVADGDWKKIEDAVNERNLPGGSLIAAGGWCAPSETLYDLCPTASTDGMVSLPSVTAKRGGLKYPNVPDFSEIYSAVGFHQTEADAESGKEKTCYEIPCTDFSECRLDVDGLCITTPILTERAWPELVRYFVDQALAAHAHKLNAFKIATMAAQATAVTVAGPTSDDPPVDCHGPGATPTLLSVLEVQVEQARYKYRLSRNATLEMVAPAWLRGLLRADLSKRLGVDMLNVSDAQIDTYLRSRGVNPQFVVDWQDALATGTATDFGGASFAGCWPEEVQILLYPASTFFLAESDVITLDAIYDSVNIRKNVYTKLFTEEGLAVCKRCYDATLLTVPLCPNGLSGGTLVTACAAAP